MKNEELIKQLQKLPKGIEVVVCDIKEFFKKDDGGSGIYPINGVDFHKDGEDSEGRKRPFVTLGFTAK